MANTAPTEVLESICQHLSFAELKRARFVCRSFNPAARRYLFREVLVNCDLEGFRKLSYISRQPDLARWVQKLHLNDRIVAVNPLEFQDWSAKVVKEKIPITSGSEQFRDSLLPAELQWHYSQYRYQIESEKRIFTGTLATDWLCDACKSFTNLASISYGPYREILTSGVELTPARRDPRIRYETLSAVAQRTLTTQSFEPLTEQKIKLILALLEAAEVCRGPLKTIEIVGAPIDTFRNFQPVLHEPDRTMSKVRNLKLHIPINTNVSPPNEIRHGLAQMFENFSKFLANTMMLKTLHLTFEWASDPIGRARIDNAYDTLSRIRQHREHWPSLRDVKFANMPTTEKALTDFLEMHAATLQSLELCDIAIIKPAAPSPPPGVPQAPPPPIAHLAPQPPHTSEPTGSWIPIINLLAQSLHLKHISLKGKLTSPRDNWIVSDEEQYYADQHSSNSMTFEPYPERSLRDRVHNFALKEADPKKPVFLCTEYSLAQLVDVSWRKRYQNAEGHWITKP